MRAIITGGTHGIGASIGKHLLSSSGVDIAIVSRSVDKLNSFMSSLPQDQKSRVTFIQGDIVDDGTLLAVKDLLVSWGGVEILVNNVGGGGRWGSEDPVETDDTVWFEVFKKNLFSAVNLTNMCLPYMLANNYGRVVSIASNYGKEVLPGSRPWFVSSKAALIAYMKVMSKQTKYTSNNITFNTISPGPLMIDNTGWEDVKRGDPMMFSKFVDDNIPVGFMAGEDSVVHVFDLIWKSKYINGENIVVDGGMSNSY